MVRIEGFWCFEVLWIIEGRVQDGKDFCALRDDVPSKVCVLGNYVRNSDGEEVSEPLNLVDDGIGVRHVGSVIESGSTVRANHAINLLMDFLSDVGVLEHEQESIAECGAGGLCASKEEGECSDNEVSVMELSIRVGLLFVHADQVGINEVAGIRAVQSFAVLLHTAINEVIDFLQISTDLPVCAREVLQEAREELKHLAGERADEGKCLEEQVQQT